MIGKNVIEIGEKEFLDGMTTSPDTSDGGFSPETYAVNVVADVNSTGVLYATANASSITSTNGRAIASCADPDSGLGVSRYVLTDTGRFYGLDTNYASTLRQTGSKVYTKVTSDIVVYFNKLYATSTLNITEASGAILGTIDENWWVTTKGKTALTANPHPMVVFENNLWIGDGKLLHKWDAINNVATSAFLTLPDGQIIIALVVDPSSGKMLISVSEGINSNASLPRLAKVLTYDGFSAKVSRSVIVDDIVTAMYPLGGTVFMMFGNRLGYWNGSGITFLRRIAGATLDTTFLVYKHMITSIGSTLYVADGNRVTAFGDLYPGQKKFYPRAYFGGLLNARLDCLFNLGSDFLGTAFELTATAGTFDLWKINIAAKTTGTLFFLSKKYKFPRPVYVREVRIEYADSITDNATPAVVTLIDQEKSSKALPVLTNDTGVATYVRNIKYNGPNKFTTLQFKYDNTATTSVIAGIRRILIYYDPAE